MLQRKIDLFLSQWIKIVIISNFSFRNKKFAVFTYTMFLIMTELIILPLQIRI